MDGTAEQLSANPDVPLNGGPDAANPMGRSGSIGVMNFEVREFVSQMCERRVGAQQLSGRLTTHTSPQRRTAGSSVPAEVDPVDAFALELKDLTDQAEDLAAAIREGKSRIGGWDRFIARIKSWLPGRDMLTETAKRAFSKIDQDSQLVILQLAFHHAASPRSLENVSANVQNLLKFCQTANIDANTITNAIDSIPNPAGKTKVLAALGQPNSGFNWNRLDANATKRLVLALAKASKPGPVHKPSPKFTEKWTRDPDLAMANEQCAYRLRQLIFDDNNLEDLKNMEPKEFILDLIDAGWCCVGCLDRLIRNGRLGSINLNDAEFKEFVSALGKSSNGGEHLKLLLGANLLNLAFENADTANQIALALSKIGPAGPKCLECLADVMNLNPDADTAKKLAINLAKWGDRNCFQLLFGRGCFNSLNLDADFILDMTNAGYYGHGVECLGRLLTSNPLRFEGDAAIQLVERLSKSTYGADCLKLLLEKNLLNPTFKDAGTAKAFTRDLIGVGENGATCVRLLLEENILNPDILNLGDADTAKEFVMSLSNAGLNGAHCVWQLFRDGHLNSLNLEDVDTARVFALTLSKVGEDENECAVRLWQLLKGEELRNLRLERDVANDFALALFRLKERGTDCVQLAIGKGYLGSLNPDEDFVYNLVDLVENGDKDRVTCLKLLLDARKLDRLPTFEHDTVEDLHSRLARALSYLKRDAYEERECLENLYDKINHHRWGYYVDD
ncbi:MAG: hypothetical protein LBB17_02650 [Puniceicoccales bacterium]|jgi:hypothetical protein|nr:hypothetical protein [Puniceicoccales bacterium]